MRKHKVLLSVPGLIVALFLSGGVTDTASAQQQQQQQQSRLVEDVEVQGNRRLRSEDILYYARTRPGQPYDERQVRRDLAQILALPFFDRAQTQVTTQDGAKGGLVVTFEVAELPLVREVKFEGLGGVDELDVVSELRRRRVDVGKGAVYDEVKMRRAAQVVKSFLVERGWSNSAVVTLVNVAEAATVAVTFKIDLRR